MKDALTPLLDRAVRLADRLAEDAFRATLNDALEAAVHVRPLGPSDREAIETGLLAGLRRGKALTRAALAIYATQFLAQGIEDRVVEEHVREAVARLAVAE